MNPDVEQSSTKRRPQAYYSRVYVGEGGVDDRHLPPRVASRVTTLALSFFPFPFCLLVLAPSCLGSRPDWASCRAVRGQRSLVQALCPRNGSRHPAGPIRYEHCCRASLGKPHHPLIDILISRPPRWARRHAAPQQRIPIRRTPSTVPTIQARSLDELSVQLREQGEPSIEQDTQALIASIATGPASPMCASLSAPYLAEQMCLIPWTSIQT